MLASFWHAFVASSARAVPRGDSTGTVNIEPSKITGVLLERDIIEAKEPIDRNGDMLTTPAS
jgi:hypothetical protein